MVHNATGIMLTWPSFLVVRSSNSIKPLWNKNGEKVAEKSFDAFWWTLSSSERKWHYFRTVVRDSVFLHCLAFDDGASLWTKFSNASVLSAVGMGVSK